MITLRQSASQKNTCFKEGCSAKHHTTLHDYFISKQKKRNKDSDKHVKNGSKSAKKEGESIKVNTYKTSKVSERVFLQIVLVRVMKNDGETVITFALLDNGSQITLIREDFAKQLKLRGYSRTIKISSIKDEPETIIVKEISLKIYDMDHKNEVEVEARTLPKRMFNMPSQSSATNGDNQKTFDHLQDIQIPNICASKVTILIGANAPDVFLQLELRRGNPSQPYAIKTILGWSLLGNNTEREKPQKGGREYRVNRIEVLQHDEMLDQIVKRFWETEHCLCANSRGTAMSIEDKLCLKVLEVETKIVNGKYEVPMLWKQIDSRLPNNHEMALRRLISLHERFLGNPELFEKYRETINTYIKECYARKIRKEETINTSDKTWYLSHHPVFHPQKPGKVRVVFDAATKYKGKSLNKELFPGPELLNSLVGVLLRFRNHKKPFGDVEAMFHQVRVKPSDRDALWFLWADSPFEDPTKIDTYQMLVHIFGATDSPCCTYFAVKCVARDNKERCSRVATESILKSFYADDLLKSVITTEEAVNLAKKIADVMRRGGFRLTKFKSNDKDVVNSKPVAERAKSFQTTSFNDNISERTLGVKWDVTKNIFTFDTVKVREEDVTKRNILKTIASIFDPVGFVAPFLVTGKIFLQELRN